MVPFSWSKHIVVDRHMGTHVTRVFMLDWIWIEVWEPMLHLELVQTLTSIVVYGKKKKKNGYWSPSIKITWVCILNYICIFKLKQYIRFNFLAHAFTPRILIPHVVEGSWPWSCCFTMSPQKVINTVGNRNSLSTYKNLDWSKQVVDYLRWFHHSDMMMMLSRDINLHVVCARTTCDNLSQMFVLSTSRVTENYRLLVPDHERFMLCFCWQKLKWVKN